MVRASPILVRKGNCRRRIPREAHFSEERETALDVTQSTSNDAFPANPQSPLCPLAKEILFFCAGFSRWVPRLPFDPCVGASGPWRAFSHHPYVSRDLADGARGILGLRAYCIQLYLDCAAPSAASSWPAELYIEALEISPGCAAESLPQEDSA